jgi:hypothetical protein
MDHWFDNLIKSLAAGSAVSRRSMLWGTLGLAGTAFLGRFRIAQIASAQSGDLCAVCGGVSCKVDDVCVNGKCCSIAVVCAGVCCKPGEHCVNGKCWNSRYLRRYIRLRRSSPQHR